MDIEPSDPEFEVIARLIREEERSALETFRRRDFRREVEARIGEFSHQSRPPFLLLRRLSIPVGVAALLLIAAWAFFHPHPAVRGVVEVSSGFVSGLEGLPGMAEFASRHASREAEGGGVPEAPPSIREVLSWAQKSEPEGTGSTPPNSGILRVQRLSLERKMIILFKDRAIERVLVLIRKKSEEA